MIKANHKNFWVKFSNIYSKILLKIYFRNIKYIGDYEHTEKPVLIIANHFSWWDGFIQIQLNNKYFKRKFHFMMLEKELKKSEILTAIGACSISKGKRSSLESLAYSVEILQNKRNLFLFFPQGRIRSVYTKNFIFEKGMLSYLLENLKNDYQFIFNVNLIDYAAFRKPEIRVNYKTYDIKDYATTDEVEKDFNFYANECISKLQRK